MQTIRGGLGGAGLLVVRHAGVGDDGTEVVDGVARSWTAAKAVWCFPSLAAPPRSDRARSVGGFRGAAVNFGYRALGPHPLLLWRCATGAHNH